MQIQPVKIQEIAALCDPEGHRNIIRLLLNTGVDTSATTCYKRTALNYAAIGKHDDVFQSLWEADIKASRKGLLLRRQRPATLSHPQRPIPEKTLASASASPYTAMRYET